MFKLSKESKITFIGLLIVPLIWIVLNHFSLLDKLKVKALDWRMQLRGEISHRESPDAEQPVSIEGNESVARVPRITYVNLDARTISKIGEKPWDRDYFGKVAKVLLERGEARVIAYDFCFSPLTASSLVPKENLNRADDLFAEVVQDYPQQMVLGAMYTKELPGFIVASGTKPGAPLLKEGYDANHSAKSTYRYPEAPTYPIQNYVDDKYVGRLGVFSLVGNYRSPDGMDRWLPLWYPGGGKAQAYNVLGGKQLKLAFDLRNESYLEITQLENSLPLLISKREEENDQFEKISGLVAALSFEKRQLEQKFALLNTQPKEANSLKSNSDSLLVSEDSSEIIKIKAQIAQLDESIGNFEKTLEANPAISAIVKPQLEARESERSELVSKLEKLEVSTQAKRKEIPVQVVDEKILDEIEEVRNAIAAIDERLNNFSTRVAESKGGLAKATSAEAAARSRLDSLLGSVDTELLETQDTLRLIYKRPEGDAGNGVLVESFPNQMPLEREGRFFGLGLEALLAYYGLDEKAVKLSSDNKSLTIVNRDSEELFVVPMEDGQFVEVNWFSKWSEPIPEVEALKKARDLYVDEDFQGYVELSPKIIRGFLNRVKDLDLPEDDSDLPLALEKLMGIGAGLEKEHVQTAISLLDALKGKIKEEDAPEFERLLALSEAIETYFLPVLLDSQFNPMCGMWDVLRSEEDLLTRETDLANLDGMILKIETEVIPKIELFLKTQPENESGLAKMEEVRAVLKANKERRLTVLNDIKLLNSFFAKFQDTIVFIGPVDAALKDIKPTPLESEFVPLVGIHGNLVKTITSGLYIKRLPDWVDHLTTACLSLLMAFLAVYSGPKSSWMKAGGISLLAGYVLFAIYAFTQTHVLWPVTTPTCGGLSTTFIGMGIMLVNEQKAKGRLKGMFGSYVSAELVDQMVDSGEEPHLGGEETAITAFFSDVQAFSSFSELLTPTGLVDLMNEYLTAMTDILQEERGTLDKYIGDAIVAMYGAPIPMDDHAYQSVRTALRMQEKQLDLRDKWAQEEEKWGKCYGLVKQMQTRIGCNTGTATVGNMGALDRFNYTMMGDMVNLAARCESGAKAYGAYIMITEETKLASEKTKDDIAFRYLDKIVVKGRSQPVSMYEPTGFMADLGQETQDCLDCFKQGIDKYLLWDGALSMFEKAKDLEPNKPGITPGVKDNPSMILIDRCQVMKENPPGDDWDGVYVMTSK